MRSPISRRAFLSTAATTAAAQPPRRQPNIVFFLADDLGYRDLGCTGNSVIRTPNLDALARSGMRFTDFYVSWPACTPSRGSILTGRYPQRNGLYDMIRNNEVNWKFQFDEQTYALSPEMTLGLDLREITIGQALKKAGYRTGIFGKWDSGRARRYLPTQRGFDTFYGFANTGIDFYTHERYGVASMFRNNERVKEPGHATDLFTREALRFIDENRSRPFFLYVPYNAPHIASTFDKSARQAPEEYLAMYPALKGRQQEYAALTTHMDTAIGQILARLRQYGLEDDTVVIFSSDNGGDGAADNTPLRGRKATMYEGGLRVPLIVRWPKQIAPGQVSREFATTLDLFPTLVGLAGGRPEPGVVLDGFDMEPVWRGQAKHRRTEMFWQEKNDKAARAGNWKWVETAMGGGLFDLGADPSENNDLSAQRPEVLAMMRTKWSAWRKEMDAAEPRGPFRDY
jgi:arylsulfatase A-like enzyme